jgi:hypothetical protein
VCTCALPLVTFSPVRSCGMDDRRRRKGEPQVDATDKLLRYETHLDRQLYRAMDQLERLQRQRRGRGEAVPPPLNINVGRRRRQPFYQTKPRSALFSIDM